LAKRNPPRATFEDKKDVDARDTRAFTPVFDRLCAGMTGFGGGLRFANPPYIRPRLLGIDLGPEGAKVAE